MALTKGAPTPVEETASPTHGARRRPTQERSRKRFDEILEAASRLIADRGLEPITMTDIADEANMAVTAVYRYFPNKQAIVRELTLRTFEVDERLNAQLAADESLPPPERVRKGLETYCFFHLDDRVRLQIRAAMQADAELAALDLVDSRHHAAALAEAIDFPGSGVPRRVLEQRALVLIELVDSAIRLASRVDPDEAKMLIREFAEGAAIMLLRPVTSDTTAP